MFARVERRRGASRRASSGIRETPPTGFQLARLHTAHKEPLIWPPSSLGAHLRALYQSASANGQGVPRFAALDGTRSWISSRQDDSLKPPRYRRRSERRSETGWHTVSQAHRSSAQEPPLGVHIPRGRKKWSGRLDSNQRPPAPKAKEPTQLGAAGDRCPSFFLGNSQFGATAGNRELLPIVSGLSSKAVLRPKM